MSGGAIKSPGLGMGLTNTIYRASDLRLKLLETASADHTLSLLLLPAVSEVRKYNGNWIYNEAS